MKIDRLWCSSITITCLNFLVIKISEFQIGITQFRTIYDDDTIDRLSSLIAPSSVMILAILLDLHSIENVKSSLENTIDSLQRKHIPDTIGPNIDLILGIRAPYNEDLCRILKLPSDHFFIDAPDLDTKKFDFILDCYNHGKLSIITDNVPIEISIEKLIQVSLIVTESIPTATSLIQRGYFGALPFMNLLLKKGMQVAPKLPERSVMSDLCLLETINLYTLEKSRFLDKRVIDLTQLDVNLQNEIDTMSFTEIMKLMLKGSHGAPANLERVTFRSPVLDSYLLGLTISNT